MSDDLDREEFCYVTTKGRRTGHPHTIEIWFSARAQTLFILSGDANSDWVKNIQNDPAVVVKIGEHAYRGKGRIVTDDQEAAFAREAVPIKYAHREDGLEEWAKTAVPVAVDLA